MLRADFSRIKVRKSSVLSAPRCRTVLGTPPMSLVPMLAAMTSGLVIQAPRYRHTRMSTDHTRMSADHDHDGCDCECILSAPSALDLQLLQMASPTPSYQPREVIETMMHALHRSAWDHPYPYFGFEVALQFLSPSHQYREYQSARTETPESLARYLRSPHKAALISWNEFKWEGETTCIDQAEAYQQVSVRANADDEWTSVRWMLKRVATRIDAHSQWMVDAVFVQEPDYYYCDFAQPYSSAQPAVAEAGGALVVSSEGPRAIAERVMRALRKPDEPYRLHGAEVAVRFCSPTNAAAQLTPAMFASYLKEPHYLILSEWDEIDFDDETDVTDSAEAEQDVLVRRSSDKTWSAVSFRLSRHNGRWLVDSLGLN